eukprot:c41771_g1_i1 orf=146-328(+)
MAATTLSTHAVSKLYHIEKLTGPSYLPWSLRSRMTLEKADFWGVVNGTNVNPRKAQASSQ